MLTAQSLENLAGREQFLLGQGLYRHALVRETRRTRQDASYTVLDGAQRVRVLVNAENMICDCGREYCRHIVAAALFAMESGVMRDIEKHRAVTLAPELLDAMSGMLPESDDVKLLPTIILSEDGLRLTLRVGEDRLYVVRSIPQFLKCRAEDVSLPFGKNFTYEPRWMRFDERQSALLDALAEYCEAPGAAALTGPDARALPLAPLTAKRILNTLHGLPFRLQIGDSESEMLPGISDKPLDINFHLSGTARQISISVQMPESILPLTPDYAYVLCRPDCIEVPPEHRAVIRRLCIAAPGGTSDFAFPERDTGRVMGELMPFLLRVGTLTVDPALEDAFIRMPLVARVYLDKEGRDVTAKVHFLYGDHIYDSFSPLGETHPALLLRDAAGERHVIDELARDGFRVRRGVAYLSDQEKLIAFVTEGASRLSACAEVFFSKEFKRLSPRKPTLRGAMRLINNRLTLTMYDGDTPLDEFMPLMEALRRRRRYFRFRDGTFLDLSDETKWQALAEAVAESESDPANLGACRTAYFSSLVRADALPVTLDDDARRAAQFIIDDMPLPLSCLRPYQERGFRWLCALHEMHMGGVLADDMGLGKTVQAIALILAYQRTQKEKLPSLIVAPTSLTYNWMSELKRFAPEMRVMLMQGGQAARGQQMDALLGDDAPDVVITSYPLIRRDIALMCDIPFRFAILDEAQQIKNISSVGAQAVKQLNAQTRYALTGTPMENHAGELWSIFDFVLPGYLPRYTDYLRRYGEGQNAEDLRRRIRPFLMRRLKSEVLCELPEKLESVMMAELAPEQRRVYDAALILKRERVNEILRVKGLQRGRAEVLSAITELRQICCHPALCLPEYQGVSAKTELLMDMLLSALDSGRRVLVFSQFTSMLRIIEKRLGEAQIASLYLDGETPPAERLTLTNRYNSGEKDVFLISLKAGGTGLNLTGADMVIHYDPWWNPTAEEQATGRAHRIGQTRNVEVIRLIAHNSIEEQVLSMSDRKRRLFDRLITPGEEMPTKLSEKDILSLFDGRHK